MKMFTSTKNRQNILENTADLTAMRLFFVLAFLLLSCSGVFGQDVERNQVEITVTQIISADASTTVAEASTTAAQMELVSWLMGSKQANNAATDASKSSTATTTKKQLINCGMTPNRLLSRTLLKKAMQYEANIA